MATTMALVKIPFRWFFILFCSNSLFFVNTKRKPLIQLNDKINNIVLKTQVPYLFVWMFENRIVLVIEE